MPRNYTQIASSIALLLSYFFGASALAQDVSPDPQPAIQPVAPSSPQAANLWSAEAFAQTPQIEKPQLSPDGSQVAGLVMSGGEQFFSITNVDTAQTAFIGVGDMDINWWRWVNNEWLVVGFGAPTKVAGRDWYLSRVASVRADGTEIKTLSPRDAAQDADDVIWVARDGSPRILLSYQTSIYVSDRGFWPRIDEIDVATGRRRAVQNGRAGVMDWYADASGFIRMGVGYSEDGRFNKLYYRDPGHASFRTVDRARTADRQVVAPAMFLEDGNSAIVFDEDSDGFDALFKFDLTTLERGEKLYSASGSDLGGLFVDRSGTRLLGVGSGGEDGGIHWFTPEMEALAAKIAARVPNSQTQITSLSADQSRAVVYVGDASAPGAYFLYDTADESMRLLTYVNDQIGLRRVHPVRTIQYRARDGLRISAILTTPRDAGKAMPLIVMPHGGPYAHDSEQWDWWAQFLADRGYVVVQPNYRGSSGFGAAFAARGDGEWGLKMQDDLDDAVTALAELGIADPERVCIVGGSYGGYAAMRAAQRNGDRYRCAVSFAGVSDLNAMRGYNRRFLHSEARNDRLSEQAPDLKEVSPINFAEQFSTPILLIHGREDMVVPYAQSREMAEKLEKAGRDFEFVEFPEGDHHLSRYEDRLRFLELLEAFLTKHNPARP